MRTLNARHIKTSEYFFVFSFFVFNFCSEGDWVPFSAMSWAWMKDSNHFSGLTSAFRAAYEQSNLKVGLISAFDRHTSLKLGLISAFDRHTSINRSISADHALAHALEFGRESGTQGNLVPRVFVPFCACWLYGTSDSRKIRSRSGFDWLFKNNANYRK